MESTLLSSSEKNNTCTNAYNNIRIGAKLDLTYVLMNTIATIIACYGLFANSPAVVIGAMVAVMLLGPIIGIALGVIEAYKVTLRTSLISEITPVTIIVRAVVRGPYIFTPSQVADITTKLPDPPNGLTLDFRVRFVQTTVITDNGYLFTDPGGP
jgi:hypothetical protein